jgi:hypothetical protein
LSKRIVILKEKNSLCTAWVLAPLLKIGDFRQRLSF